MFGIYAVDGLTQVTEGETGGENFVESGATVGIRHTASLQPGQLCVKEVAQGEEVLKFRQGDRVPYENAGAVLEDVTDREVDGFRIAVVKLLELAR